MIDYQLRQLYESEKDDGLDLLIDTWISSGVSRRVYTCRIINNAVVKVEGDSGHSYHRFQNVRERDIWEDFKNNKKAAEFLAPVIFMSTMVS